jgi:hypothetical protein
MPNQLITPEEFTRRFVDLFNKNLERVTDEWVQEQINGTGEPPKGILKATDARKR